MNRKLKKQIKSYRRYALATGHDLSAMSDEDIKQQLENVCSIVAGVGARLTEASNLFESLRAIAKGK
jgi:predicted methyltransferase